jgi:hypothetical protein
MPSRKIFAKLILRATQIQDPISELNPEEWMDDKRLQKVNHE